MKEIKKTLIDQVQHNSDVSDSRYWGYYSLCGLLMSLRTLYMIKHDLQPWERVDHAGIQEWISAKEKHWEELEDADFINLTIRDRGFNPFSVDAINDALKGEGVVYGAGYGLFKKPSFFLADIHETRRIDGHTIYITKKEHARDMSWSPGMSQDKLIFVRLEPLRVLLWDKLLESSGKNNAALAFAFSQFGFGESVEIDEAFAGKFDDLIHSFSEVVLYHELGEEAVEFPHWAEMIFEVDAKHAEFFIRAVKDLLADTSEHGPIHRFTGLQDKRRVSLCIALMDRYKLTYLYPELRTAFDEFIQTGDWVLLENARSSVYARTGGLRDALVAMYTGRKDKEEFIRNITELSAE